MAGPQIHAHEFGPFCIDVASRVLLRGGKPIPLEPKVFDTLLALVENHTRVVGKEELMKAVWGPDTFVEEGSLTRNISLLRKVLADGLNGALSVATFPKRGYQFVAPVRKVTGTPESEPGASVGARRRFAPAAVTGSPRSERRVRAGGDALADADGGHPGGVPLRGDLDQRWLAQILRRHPMTALALSLAVLALALGYWFVRPLPAPVVINYEPLTHDGKEKPGPLVTDGSRLYFVEKVDGKWMLAVMPSAGGDPSTFPLPSPEASISDVAPDGSDLLGWGAIPGFEGPRLLVWSAPGGSLENPAGLQGKYPTWSPDRTSIAYSDGVHSLFVAGRHGENPHKVASVDGCPQYVRWSPDGRSLRFSQLDPKSEVNSLWEVSAVGGQPHPSLAGWKRAAAGPAWTADGSYCLFESGPTGRADIWARREDCNPLRWRCREPVRLTRGPLIYTDPLPSRDGSKLFVIGRQSGAELVRYDLKSKTFVPYLPTFLAGDADFSPDGNSVAYARLPERTLWRSRTDGSVAVALTVTGARVYSPHWSPDGKQIAYMAVSAQNQYKAYAVPADGGPPQQLLPGAGEEGIPTWSRDGKFVVLGDVLHGLHASEMAIHLLDLRNHQLSTLPGSNGLWTPRWSPDGRYIAALALGDEAKGQLALCPAALLYDFRTRRWATLAKAPNIRNLAWSRDSRYVYFDTGWPDPGMYRVPIPSKKIERLASLEFSNADAGDWIGAAPDGSPLVVKATHIQEVYALDMQWH